MTIAEDLSTIAAVEQLTQEELDWYNESFFNQAISMKMQHLKKESSINS